MTWIWASLLLVLSAPFVLWPLVRAAAPADPEAGAEEDDPEGPQAPPSSGD